MEITIEKKNPMIGKRVDFKVGNRDSLEKMNKVLIPVEMYIDGESGTLYLVPQDDIDLKKEFGFKIEKWFENIKKICYNKIKNDFKKWNE